MEVHWFIFVFRLAAMPSLEPVGFPHLGVGLQGGLQLVRDPTSGHLLLIHAAGKFFHILKVFKF